jgi:hypothetical protein
MKRVILSFFFAVIAQAGFSQSETRTFNVSNFNRLDIGSAFTITVTKGPFKVTAKGDDDDVNDLEAMVENGELRIRYKDRKGISLWSSRDDVYLNISMPSLRGVDFSGATTTKINGFTSKQMDIELSGASTLTMELSADVINVDCSGASDLTLRGDADVLKVELSGASDFKATDLKVLDVTVEASGASDAKVFAQNKIVANASGASDIRFRGPVSNVKKSSSGGSSVKSVE